MLVDEALLEEACSAVDELDGALSQLAYFSQDYTLLIIFFIKTLTTRGAFKQKSVSHLTI